MAFSNLHKPWLWLKRLTSFPSHPHPPQEPSLETLLHFPHILPDHPISSSNPTTWPGWPDLSQPDVDPELDAVIVPSFGCQDSDWSVGWFEPHSLRFCSSSQEEEDDSENGFAVLVPCYGPPSLINMDTREAELRDGLENAAVVICKGPEIDWKHHLEQWLSSLKG